MTNSTSQKRTLEEYLSLPYTIRVLPATPSGYVASVQELPGCITQAETWEETGEMIRDAMRAWIAAALEDGLPVPEPMEDMPPAKVLLRLPRSLHQGLVREAEREGVRLNQLVVYHLGRALGEADGASHFNRSG
jgi:antitoxin HicB